MSFYVMQHISQIGDSCYLYRNRYTVKKNAFIHIVENRACADYKLQIYYQMYHFSRTVETQGSVKKELPLNL